jgi:serine/threonine protein kinase/Tol biopolymer transport system component
MTPERWQQIKEVFSSALELAGPERSRFLGEACAGDGALRSEVESLLSSHEKEGGFIDAPAYEVAAGVLANKSSSIVSGQTLGSYRILSILGRGGMGEVYLAEDSRLGRKVALKLLPSSFTNDAERLARFEREARAASGLNHPNILTIYEVGSFDGRQFIAAEYVEGETLRQRQAHSRLDLAEVLDLAIQVASALAAAHQAGIVHRDIKPENLMLRRDGYAKVVDFGLAKLTQTAKASADTSLPTMLQVDTGTGVVMGTTAYMSPEQARGIQLDARTDIWSLGVVLYEALSGIPPFKGDTASDLIVSILEREPAPLVTTPLLPSEVDWIVRKALRKDREERYQTARELLGDLRGLRQQLEFARMERSVSPDSDTSPLASQSISTGLPKAPAYPTDAPVALSTAEIEQTPTIPPTQPAAAARKRNLGIAAAVAVLLIGSLIAAYKFWPTKVRTAPFQTMKITRLTNSGQVIDAILSPDGKYVAYVLSDAGKQSAWIRQVSTANDKQIVPPAPVGFFGLTFSRDGNDLYYAIKQLDAGTLYRVPMLGGTPAKILTGVDAPISFSPDGKQFVLIRGNYPNQGESALVIVNVSGTNERVLAVRKAPEFFTPLFFTGPSWSPDGKLVAATVGRTGGVPHVFAFAIADGKSTDLTPDSPWRQASRVEWLPDMSGLLVIAGENLGNSQVWFLSYPDGDKRRITNDLNSYRAIGLAADATRFSAVQASGLVNIWVAPEGDAKRAVQLSTGNVGWFISSGNSLSWTPDGQLVFVSNESSTLDIWLMDADGGNRHQLTSNSGQNTSPTVSVDGRHIVFVSNRAGGRNVWRMDLDGNNPRQLTTGRADMFPSISPDGSWVFYTASMDGIPNILKVSIDGGESVAVTKNASLTPSVSPDGKFLSYLFPEAGDPLGPPNHIAVMPIDGGEPIKTFKFEVARQNNPYSEWSADGKSILYAVTGNVSNIWSQPLDGGPPKQVTDFKESLMTGFAWSRDGKKLATTRGNLLRDAVLISEAK